ncbi:hypothetical protein D3C71_1503780 [compost metagenome]
MNRQVMKATQNITELKPRPSRNSLPTVGPPALSSAGTRNSWCGSSRTSGRIFRTTSRRWASPCCFIRKGSDSGMYLRMNGISTTGAPAARNTDCQP